MRRAGWLSKLGVVSISCVAGLALAQTAPPEPPRAWEGAAGLIVRSSPEYSGAERQKLHLLPALYLRWGRFTVTNAGGFVDRRNDDVERGLAVDLVEATNWRVKLGLRYDPGRDESASGALAGMGDIKLTVRARIVGTWKPDPAWRVVGAWSMDALGRGGGNQGDLSVAREGRWRTGTWAAGVSLGLAGDRYLQTYYGVSAAQSARSGYRVYTPGAGLRDVSVFVNTRQPLAPRWVMVGGIGAGRLLGDTVDSPLVKKTQSASANVGLAYEF